MSFKKGKLRCNYCKEVMRVVAKKDYRIYSDNTQVAICDKCCELQGKPRRMI